MRLSVVIPVLDDVDELRGVLEALDRQTRPADEIIIVDNGCTDDSAAVAEAAGARVVEEPLRGIPAAAAAGFDAAEGDVLARIDADSRPGPDWAARLVAHFETDPDLPAVTGPGTFIGLTGWRAIAARVLYMEAYFASVGSALAHPPLFGSNHAVRREFWLAARDRIHRTDSEIHDDIDLSFQLDPRRPPLVDRALTVGISARPFDDASLMRKRFRRAFRSFGVNWPDSPPWDRWRRRLFG